MNRRMAGRPVYSTDPSFQPPCETCGELPERCRCSPPEAPPPEAQAVRIRLETKGRGGKAVTVIDGIQGPPETHREICRALQAACGTGGTVKEGTIELQGDRRERAEEVLRKKGYRPKRAGG